MERELGDISELLDGPEDTVGWVTSLEFRRDETLVTLRVEIESFGDAQVWTRHIACKGAVHWVVNESPVYQALVTDKHPALRMFLEHRGELFFNGECDDPVALAYSLRAVHEEILESFVPFYDVVNAAAGDDVVELLRNGFGKIADGPMSLIDRYSALMEGQGISTSVVAHGPPKIYDELKETWVETDKPFELLDLGATYVIGNDFEVLTGS